MSSRDQDIEIVVDMPEPPADLDEVSLKMWMEFAPWMISDGPIERRVLMRYCIATSLWHKAVQELARNGSVYAVRSRDGSRISAVREMPHAAHVRSLEVVLRACEQSLRPYLASSSSPLRARSRSR